MSQQYADFTAETPKNKQTPWQPARHPRGQDAWNHTEEARDHPEWYTTAHGTLDLETEKEIMEKREGKSTEKAPLAGKTQPSSFNTVKGIGFGHTVPKPRISSRPVHRDLTNI
ncbi:hypothetical protein DFQ30_009880 [Apophysomyces sp. BC1015]|nr:hypothetical protein DFQ30_009880 [Apophysomyces sp. BC1015]